MVWVFVLYKPSLIEMCVYLCVHAVSVLVDIHILTTCLVYVHSLNHSLYMLTVLGDTSFIVVRVNSVLCACSMECGVHVCGACCSNSGQ